MRPEMPGIKTRGTLTGWTQSWIVATQVLVARDQNYWDLTDDASVEKHLQPAVNLMFGGKTPNGNILSSNN